MLKVDKIIINNIVELGAKKQNKQIVINAFYATNFSTRDILRFKEEYGDYLNQLQLNAVDFHISNSDFILDILKNEDYINCYFGFQWVAMVSLAPSIFLHKYCVIK